MHSHCSLMPAACLLFSCCFFSPVWGWRVPCGLSSTIVCNEHQNSASFQIGPARPTVWPPSLSRSSYCGNFAQNGLALVLGFLSCHLTAL
ncbi:hypothetical protein B0H16DRAFT_150215 [Mycena metata]|uniref:Secreted protein n=1 Tax=Mycena metata TaxID=1033252 RepID=A0AAD7JZB5_9AGAR|nr:hypothetical protein B0H16DRAFT_150215 [Mycena metata]